MKVIIELEISDCKKCPHFEYKGTSWEIFLFKTYRKL